jgi:GDP-mannose 6-dehydrogenase
VKVAVFGLGYVGTVCGACFAAMGHRVIGVDVNPVKVDMINEGKSPIVEPGLDDLLGDAARTGAFRATSDPAEAVRSSDISLVCVGTPSGDNGALNLDFVYGVCGEIADVLAGAGPFYTVVIRSTVLPGTVERCAGIIAERSGRTRGEGFAVASNPEFLREGSAIRDFCDPPFTVIGTEEQAAADMLAALYDGVPGEVLTVQPREAEMLKYVCNSFHALKVAFANEVGTLCKALGADSHRVMELFCRDKRLNISPAYFRPGFAFGGSCLPKDLAALNHRARAMEMPVPLLASIAESNRLHIEAGVKMVLGTGKRRVGVLGLSFKPATDDLRESPMVEVVERLLGKGVDVRVYDRNVSLARLIGANRSFIERQIPHIAQLFVENLDDLLADAECIVVGNADPEYAGVVARARADQVVVDFVRIQQGLASGENYKGICW